MLVNVCVCDACVYGAGGGWIICGVHVSTTTAETPWKISWLSTSFTIAQKSLAISIQQTGLFLMKARVFN